MNQRIKELAQQATEHDYTTWDSYNQKELVYYKFNKEKFAELIVKECLDVIFNGRFSDEECEGNTHRMSYNNGRFGASKDIKEHFGVE
jgi:hypothetical protein